MAKISATSGGSSPLVSAVVTPQPRENVAVRGMWVEARRGDRTMGAATGLRMGTTGLLSLDANSSIRQFRAAVRDCNGLWSEYTPDVQLTFPASATSAGTEASIGCGAASDLDLQPGGIRKVRFAPPSWHTGKSGATRVCYVTLVEAEYCYLLAIFAKNDKSNLATSERNALRGLVKVLKAAHAR